MAVSVELTILVRLQQAGVHNIYLHYFLSTITCKGGPLELVLALLLPHIKCYTTASDGSG